VRHAVKCTWTNGNQHDKEKPREFGTDTGCRLKKTKELGPGDKGMLSKWFQSWCGLVGHYLSPCSKRGSRVVTWRVSHQRCQLSLLKKR
jgi:hypothetical protein